MDNISIAGYAEPSFKVCNRMKYDIGIKLGDGRELNIRPKSFQLLTVREIQYIESICTSKKFFGTHMLEVEDDNGNVIPLEKLRLVDAPPEEIVLTEDEISAQLKKSLKQMTAWLESVKDPTELHAIYKVATEMDLPTSKLKVLRAKMPEKDWFDDLGE